MVSAPSTISTLPAYPSTDNVAIKSSGRSGTYALNIWAFVDRRCTYTLIHFTEAIYSIADFAEQVNRLPPGKDILPLFYHK